MQTDAMTESILQRYLKALPLLEGAYVISPVRGYQHAEGDYDRQYGIDQSDTEQVRNEAGHLLDICRRHGFTQGMDVLEIGCGTGRISLGLAMQADIRHLFLTDPSPVFCGIVQKKLTQIPVAAAQVDFGVLGAEDIGKLPPGAVSMILLRSVLHHISDVDQFLRDCAHVLPTGGILVCEEPYYEGYMIMGLLGQLIPDALALSGYQCTAEERKLADYFVATMQFYCRRDMDKSKDEDKHLFRPDELMVSGRAVGLELTHYPNRRITDSEETYLGTHAGYFERFFAEYVRFCMGWPRDFAERVILATQKYFQFFGPLEGGGNTTPACFGTFVFVKTL